MDENLQEKVALVTGGARRLGRAIALTLADAGAAVVVHYNHSGEAAQATAETIRQRGGSAWTLQADLSDPHRAEALIGRARERVGTEISILVNNASIFPSGGLSDLTPDSLDANLRVNALAPLFLGRALSAQGTPGQVVNLLDTRIAGHDGEHVAYLLSKQLLAHVTRLLARELAPRVTVNGVAPGPVLPPAQKDQSYLDALAARLPLGRPPRPEEIADTVRFLVCSPSVTGQVIYVDGGNHLGSGDHA